MTQAPGNPATGGDSAGPEYQSLCSLAAVALAVSLLAPFALATPLMLAAPVAAIGLALMALSKIRDSDGALTGINVARCALAISLACGVAAFVRDPVRNALMRRQTTDVARQWLADLAEGRLAQARALMSGQAVQSLAPRSPNPTDEPPPAEVIEAAVLERLGKESLTHALTHLAAPLEVTVDPDVPVEKPAFDGPRTLLPGVYRVASATGGTPLRVRLAFVRAAAYEAQGLPWRIEQWSLLGGTAHDHEHDGSPQAP